MATGESARRKSGEGQSSKTRKPEPSPEIDKLPGLSDLIGTSLEELLGASSTRTAGDGSLLDAALVAEARDMGVDVVTELNARLRELIGKARRERWLKENREALEDANAFLARHGLWSDGKRQF